MIDSFSSKYTAGKPRITVVTPSYNQGDYIERTIDSVLSQSYPNLEYIVVDGGSTDQSVEVIRKYQKHIAYWVSEKDRGQSHAINKGVQRSTGSVLAWLNSDDWYTQGALSHFAELFDQHPTAGVVVGRGKTINLQGHLMLDISPPVQITVDTLCSWMDGGDFMQPSTAFRRIAWDLAGGLSETVHIALDVDLWLKFAKAGIQFLSTPEVLSFALAHPKAKTTAFVNEMRLDCARVIATHGSVTGYEHAIARFVQDQKFLNLKLAWFERNYQVITTHPLTRFLQPIVKRLARDGRYWQGSIPPWGS